MEVVRCLVREIDVLKGKIDGLSDASSPSLSVDEAKLITSQVAQIKRKIKSLKLEGRKVYEDLEREESELQKDIRDLRQVVSDECSTSEKYLRDKSYGSSGRRKVRMQGQRAVGKSDGKLCKAKVDGGECGGGKLEGEFNSDDEISDDSIDYGNLRMEENEKTVYVKIGGFVDSKMNEGTSVAGTGKAETNNDRMIVMPKFRHAWEAKDHSQFMRIHRRHRLPQRRLMEWRRTLSYKSEMEIEDHMEKYEAYLKEKEMVKGQVSQWRSEKEQRRKEQIESVMKEKLKREENLRKEKKAREKRLRREREERYQKLAEWKEAKNYEGSEMKAPKIVEEMAATRTCDTRSKLKLIGFTDEERRVMASQLQKYQERKVKRQEEELTRMQEEEDYKKQLYNVSSRAEFRTKDEECIRSRRDQRKQEDRMREEQERRLEKIKSQVRVEVESDRGRLLKPTVSHLAYKLTPQAGGSVSAVGVDDIPHLAIPAWRRDL